MSSLLRSLRDKLTTHSATQSALSESETKAIKAIRKRVLQKSTGRTLDALMAGYRVSPEALTSASNDIKAKTAFQADDEQALGESEVGIIVSSMLDSLAINSGRVPWHDWSSRPLATPVELDQDQKDALIMVSRGCKKLRVSDSKQKSRWISRLSYGVVTEELGRTTKVTKDDFTAMMSPADQYIYGMGVPQKDIKIVEELISLIESEQGLRTSEPTAGPSVITTQNAPSIPYPELGDDFQLED